MAPSPPVPPRPAVPGATVPLARLALAPIGTGPRRLDGAWWPRSHDLGRELPSLLAALEHRWPHISRITVSRSLWRTGPAALLLGERVLRINRSDAAHSMICLLSYGIGRCDLLVVPPGTSVHEGRRLLNAASTVDAVADWSDGSDGSDGGTGSAPLTPPGEPEPLDEPGAPLEDA